MRDRFGRPLTLYQLVPKRELKFPHGHIILNSKEADIRVAKAMRKAAGRNLTTGDGGYIFEKLFERVVYYLPGRLIFCRITFWRDIAAGWELDTGIVLDVHDVRDLVLAVMRVERRWSRKTETGIQKFLQSVQANKYC